VNLNELKEKNNDLGLEYFNKLDRLAKLREKISIRWMEFAKRKIDSKLNILEDLHRHMFDIYKNSMEFLRNIYNKADDNVKKELTSLLKNSFEKSKKVYKDMHHRFEEREKKLHQEYEKIKKETERELERII
jgi:gas vesicle protein